MLRVGNVESVEILENKSEKLSDVVNECTNDECGMRHAGWLRIKGMNVRVKKLVWRWLKRGELLGNGSRKEIGMPKTGTGHREL